MYTYNVVEEIANTLAMCALSVLKQTPTNWLVFSQADQDSKPDSQRQFIYLNNQCHNQTLYLGQMNPESRSWSACVKQNK